MPCRGNLVKTGTVAFLALPGRGEKRFCYQRFTALTINVMYSIFPCAKSAPFALKQPISFGHYSTECPKNRNKQHITIMIFFWCIILYYLVYYQHSIFMAKVLLRRAPQLKCTSDTCAGVLRIKHWQVFCVVHKCRTTTPHLRADGVTKNNGKQS